MTNASLPMMEIIRRVHPLAMAAVSSGSDQANEILSGVLPFRVHRYASRREHNGWIVPDRWEVVRAEIRKDGELIWDGAAHPLGVIMCSDSFQGRVSREELVEHLFFKAGQPERIVYHCDLFYKPWRSTWGFCMPERRVNELEPGDYDVDLVTVKEPGEMKVLDYELAGETDETVILNAHNCHPAQANDDVAGIAVGIEVMRRLAQLPRRRLTYRLVVAPEHLGTVFYLADLPEEEVARFRHALFLEMLANDNRLALQRSFSGDAPIDHALAEVLKQHADHLDSPFRTVIGNDESVWEGAGIEVPCASLSRFPYDEYHTDLDTVEICRDDRLEEAAEVVYGALRVLDDNVRMERQFRGLVALSNPRYDLYMPYTDPSQRESVDELGHQWHRLMDCLPRYMDGKTTILEMARLHGLPFRDVRGYAEKFVERGLARFV